MVWTEATRQQYRYVFADVGYAGDKRRDAIAALGHWTIEITKRSDAVKGFMVLGWTVTSENVFRDDGYSGATLKRPGLEWLRERAALLELDRVLITAPDRLARNYVHQVLLLEELTATSGPPGQR